jgi:hypothetical protein
MPTMDPLLPEDSLLQWPNTVLMDPQTKQAAAYNALHHLITENASPELIHFTLTRAYQDAPWDPSKHDLHGDWNPLPSWMTGEVIHRCVLYWLRNGDESDDELRKIPPN